MEYFLGFVFICMVLGVFGIIYGKKEEAAPTRQGGNHRANRGNYSISEPVISIVKSLREKGRWKLLDAHDLYKIGYTSISFYSFSVKDTVTDEIYHLASENQHYCFSGMWPCRAKVFPYKLNKHSLPSWMTEYEKNYVVQEFDQISTHVSERFKAVEDRRVTRDKKQAKINQDKERQRLMSIYCKEGV